MNRIYFDLTVADLKQDLVWMYQMDILEDEEEYEEEDTDDGFVIPYTLPYDLIQPPKTDLTGVVEGFHYLDTGSIAGQRETKWVR